MSEHCLIKINKGILKEALEILNGKNIEVLDIYEWDEIRGIVVKARLP